MLFERLIYQLFKDLKIAMKEESEKMPAEVVELCKNFCGNTCRRSAERG